MYPQLVLLAVAILGGFLVMGYTWMEYHEKREERIRLETKHFDYDDYEF